MSYEYDRYLAQHKSNVQKGYRWITENLPLKNQRKTRQR